MNRLLDKRIWAVVAACAVGLAIAAMLEVRAVEKEESLGWDALPEAVRATLEAQRPGERPSEIEKETERGKLVYEAGYEVDGKTIEIEVSADGTLLEIETEDDDEDEDDDDGDDE